jgi:hypothetical protein
MELAVPGTSLTIHLDELDLGHILSWSYPVMGRSVRGMKFLVPFTFIVSYNEEKQKLTAKPQDIQKKIQSALSNVKFGPGADPENVVSWISAVLQREFQDYETLQYLLSEDGKRTPHPVNLFIAQNTVRFKCDWSEHLTPPEGLTDDEFAEKLAKLFISANNWLSAKFGKELDLHRPSKNHVGEWFQFAHPATGRNTVAEQTWLGGTGNLEGRIREISALKNCFPFLQPLGDTERTCSDIPFPDELRQFFVGLRTAIAMIPSQLSTILLTPTGAEKIKTNYYKEKKHQSDGPGRKKVAKLSRLPVLYYQEIEHFSEKVSGTAKLISGSLKGVTQAIPQMWDESGRTIDVILSIEDVIGKQGDPFKRMDTGEFSSVPNDATIISALLENRSEKWQTIREKKRSKSKSSVEYSAVVGEMIWSRSSQHHADFCKIKLGEVFGVADHINVQALSGKTPAPTSDQSLTYDEFKSAQSVLPKLS